MLASSLAPQTAHTREEGAVALPLSPLSLPPLPKNPLVSILISNYNYAAFLPEAIESCLCQSYSHLEIIVCDDGSTDGSPKILEQYQSRDARIKVIYQQNGGQSFALNAAFRKSTGEIICLLDADDVFLPEKAELVVKAFAADPCSGFAANRMRLVDKLRRPLGVIPSLNHLPLGWQGPRLGAKGPHVLLGLPPTSGLSLRRPVAETIFPLPGGLRAYSETLIQVLAPLVTPIVAVDPPVSEYRLHGDSLAGISRFTAARLRNIATYDEEIWHTWRRYLASPSSGLPSDFALPATRAASLLDYAYARFQSDRNSRAIFRAVPRTNIQTLPQSHQVYWKLSQVIPNWLFRKSFDFVYGQSTSKMVTRRLLMALRGVRGGPTPPNPPSHSLGKSQPPSNRSASPSSGSTPPSARPKMASSQPAHFNVLGVNVNATQIPEVVSRMQEWIKDRCTCHCIAATSIHGIIEAKNDPRFRKILNTSELNVPDGMPLVWIGRRHGHFLPRRVYGPDLLLAFCEQTNGHGYRHFFYGGEPGVAEELAATLQARFPRMITAGTLSPPFGPLTPEENEKIVSQISSASPDVLWVGLGTPKQERWMHDNKSLLRVPVMVGVGAAFNILSGQCRQAPRWMREHGLECVFRFFQEPRRLWRRYLVYGAQFVTGLALDCFRSRALPGGKDNLFAQTPTE